MAEAGARPTWLRRLARNRNIVVGTTILAGVVLAALLAGVISTHNPRRLNPAERLKAPSLANYLGTDEFGRDVYSLVLYGAQVSLLVGATTMILTSLWGIVIGLIAGYYRRLDLALMRVMDGLMAFPAILLAIALMAARGPGVGNVIFALSVVYTPRTAMLIRSTVLSIRELDYVQAAHLRGERAPYVMFVEILPNVMGPIIVEATVRLGYAIFAVAGLTFLGFGVQPPSPDWALQIADNYGLLNDTANQGYYWTVVFPGAAVASLVVGVNLIADGLQHVLDR